MARLRQIYVAEWRWSLACASVFNVALGIGATYRTVARKRSTPSRSISRQSQRQRRHFGRSLGTCHVVRADHTEPRSYRPTAPFAPVIATSNVLTYFRVLLDQKAYRSYTPKMAHVSPVLMRIRWQKRERSHRGFEPQNRATSCRGQTCPRGDVRIRWTDHTTASTV